MNQGSTQSAGENPAAVTVEFFQNFKKEIASYLAQKISFSLFHNDKYPLLHKRITELVDEKLAFSKTKLEPEDRARLISEIFAGLPKAPSTGVAENATVEDNFSKLQKEVLSHLAQRLPDGLLARATKPEVVATVSRIIAEKLSRLPVIDKGTHRKLLEMLLERIDPSLPAFIPPEEIIAAPVEETVAVPSPDSALQRDVIYFLATHMNPALFQTADRSVLRKELERALAERPDHLQRPVSSKMKESILSDIMAKGTIEFQL